MQAKIAVAGGQVVINVLSSHIAIPDFAWFCQELQGIYDGVAQDHTGGSISTLIPELAEQLSKTPDQFVVSVCSVDGQRFSIGNADDLFCLQACTNPFTYGMALEEHGVHKVHEHVGREPSGRAYNDFASFKTIPVAERTSPEREAIPHNPMISTGALLCSSLIKPELPVAARLSYYMKVWSDLCGGNVGDRNAPTCTASIMLSERENADRIKALGFMMKESNTFDGDVDLASVLELYFSTCATSVSTGMLSVAAATLGNAGQNPLTGKHVFSEDTNQSILSLMLSCGMNSESGTWAFDVGLPAKSGMSGGVAASCAKSLWHCNLFAACKRRQQLGKRGSLCKEACGNVFVSSLGFSAALPKVRCDASASRIAVFAHDFSDDVGSSSWRHWDVEAAYFSGIFAKRF